MIHKVGDAFQECPRPDTGNTCELVAPLNLSNSSHLYNPSMDIEPVSIKKDDGRNSSQSKECRTNTTNKQSERDDHSEKDDDGSGDSDENESDSEVIVIKMLSNDRLLHLS